MQCLNIHTHTTKLLCLQHFIVEHTTSAYHLSYFHRTTYMCTKVLLDQGYSLEGSWVVEGYRLLWIWGIQMNKRQDLWSNNFWGEGPSVSKVLWSLLPSGSFLTECHLSSKGNSAHIVHCKGQEEGGSSAVQAMEEWQIRKGRGYFSCSPNQTVAVFMDLTLLVLKFLWLTCNSKLSRW